MTKAFAAMTVDYLGCEYLSRDVSIIEKIAEQGSHGPTEVTYLFTADEVDKNQAPLLPEIKIRALNWGVQGATSVKIETDRGQLDGTILYRAGTVGGYYEIIDFRSTMRTELWFQPLNGNRGMLYGPLDATSASLMDWAHDNHRHAILAFIEE